MKEINEGMFSGMVRRSNSDQVKKEDMSIYTMSKNQMLKYLKSLYECDDNLEITTNFEFDWLTRIIIPIESNSNAIWLNFENTFNGIGVRSDIKTYNPEAYNYMKNNYKLCNYSSPGYIWIEIADNEGFELDDLISIIDNIIDSPNSKTHKKVNEGMFSGMVRRSNSELDKKEDGLNEDDQKDLNIFIDMYACIMTIFPDSELSLNKFKQNMDKTYKTFKHIVDIDKLKRYCDKNWDKVKSSVENRLNDNIIKKTNEGMFSGMVRRSNSDLVKKEDELDEYEHKIIDVTIEMFKLAIRHSGRENSMDGYIKYIQDISDDFEITDRLHKIIRYVKNNWDKGEMIKDNFTDIQKMNMNEGMFSGMVRRSNSEQVKKENELSEDDRNVLFIDISDFACKLLFDKKNQFDVNDFKSYINSTVNFFDYDFDIDKIQKYVDMNWDKGVNIKDLIIKVKDDEYKHIGDIVDDDLNECDCASPNGGAVFGDIAGMGPISFPHDGMPGSGDLPMPSGKVYKQVAPFDSFVKMKTKKNKKKGKDKKKKFRKEDEPCAQYSNPPIYSHVDDYREYVDRTYGNINKMK